MEQFEFRKKYEGREKIKTIGQFEQLLEDVKKDSNDYGAIIEACATMMNASFNLLSPGLTGFQAGCLMWMMIIQYGSYGEGSNLQLINWNDLIYPQYADKFNSIDKDTWEQVQKYATDELEKWSGGSEEVKAHIITVAQGKLPFGLKIRE